MELTAAEITANPLRTLSIIETYSACMRTVLADLDESPAPRRQRGIGVEAKFGNDQFDPFPPGAIGDFMGNLSAMVDKQTNSQAAGHASSEVRNFAVALEALGDDDPLRDQVRKQLADRLAALEPAALEPYDGGAPAVPPLVIETGVATPVEDSSWKSPGPVIENIAVPADSPVPSEVP